MRQAGRIWNGSFPLRLVDASLAKFRWALGEPTSALRSFLGWGNEVNKKDPWKFEDNYATPLIGALATAFNRMAVQFAWD